MKQLPDRALWDAFTDGFQFVDADGDSFTMKTEEIGALVLPSGRIVASDPLLDPFRLPFSIRVKPGRYPVFAAITQRDVALVMVRFRARTPVRWKTAKPDCFTVDSATGCLMDYRVARFLRRKSQANKYRPYYERFNEHRESSLNWDSVCLDESSGTNAIVFHTYGGDGRFPSFYGYDRRGRVVCLVTDMFLHHAMFDGWKE